MLKLKKLKRYVISHWDMPHSLNCTCYICYISVISVILIVIVIAGEKKNGVQKRDIGWGPQPLRSSMCTEAFAASSCWAHSTWPKYAASCSGVEPQHRRRRDRRSLSSRAEAVAAQDVHGGALRHEERHDRPVAAACCLVQRCSATEDSVEAVAVAAQVAPDGREVAVGRRVGDVVVSAPGGIKPKWRCVFFFFFSFDLSVFSKSKSAISLLWYWTSIESVRNLNLLNFEVPDVQCYGTWSTTSNLFYRSSAWGSIKFYSQYTDWAPDVSQPRLRRRRLVLDLPAGVVFRSSRKQSNAKSWGATRT